LYPPFFLRNGVMHNEGKCDGAEELPAQPDLVDHSPEAGHSDEPSIATITLM
jgi:hypothetical protein